MEFKQDEHTLRLPQCIPSQSVLWQKSHVDITNPPHILSLDLMLYIWL